MKKLSNLIIIRGTGRNVGKTLAACNIISSLSGEHEPVGIKISPHFHELNEHQKFICRSEAFVIVEEEIISNKDSSRMLQAGAKKVYYIQAKNDRLISAWELLKEFLNPGNPVVVESGGLYDYIEPELLINIAGKSSGKKVVLRNDSNVLNLPSEKVLEFNWDLIQFQNGKFTCHDGLQGSI